MKTKNTILLLVFVIFANSSYCQSETDLGSWTSAQLTKVFDKSYAMLRGECRTMQNISSVECWFLMAGGGYNFTKWLKADLSYEFWKVPSSDGNPTTHKGILTVTGTLKKEALALALREKYEFAYAQNSGTVTNTLRSRLRGQYKIGRFTPYLMYEFFNGLEGEGWIRSLHYAGSEIALGKKHSLDIFYLYNMYNIENGTSSRHIIGLGYNFTF